MKLLSFGFSRFTALVLVMGSLLFSFGCTGYQLGTGSEVKFSSLFVAPIVTDALIPQARVLVGTQVREALIRDGRVTLVNSAEQADAVLTIHLSSYDRTVSVSRQDDTGLARRFNVSLKAKATLLDQRTQRTYFADRPLEVSRGVFTDSGLVPAEYEALPLLAEKLADETVHAVLDTW